jgi:hypothetical protein
VRWTRLFDDLSGQIEAAEQADRAAETAELRRLELSRVRLADRLLGAVGARITVVVAGIEPLSGELTQVGGDWALVQGSVAESLVYLPSVTAVTDLPLTTAATGDDLDRALGIASALRRLARDRVQVSVAVRSGDAFTGTIDRVGADFLDLAEHAVDRPRRTDAVQRVRTIPFSALAVVRPA